MQRSDVVVVTDAVAEYEGWVGPAVDTQYTIVDGAGDASRATCYADIDGAWCSGDMIVRDAWVHVEWSRSGALWGSDDEAARREMNTYLTRVAGSIRGAAVNPDWSADPDAWRGEGLCDPSTAGEVARIWGVPGAQFTGPDSDAAVVDLAANREGRVTCAFYGDAGSVSYEVLPSGAWTMGAPEYAAVSPQEPVEVAGAATLVGCDDQGCAADVAIGSTVLRVWTDLPRRSAWTPALQELVAGIQEDLALVP